MFLFADRLAFDPFQQIGQHRFDMFSDISGNDDKEQIIARLQ